MKVTPGIDGADDGYDHGGIQDAGKNRQKESAEKACKVQAADQVGQGRHDQGTDRHPSRCGSGGGSLHRPTGDVGAVPPGDHPAPHSGSLHHPHRRRPFRRGRVNELQMHGTVCTTDLPRHWVVRSDVSGESRLASMRTGTHLLDVHRTAARPAGEELSQ